MLIKKTQMYRSDCKSCIQGPSIALFPLKPLHDRIEEGKSFPGISHSSYH